MEFIIYSALIIAPIFLGATLIISIAIYLERKLDESNRR
jgi:hypothetical protein